MFGLLLNYRVKNPFTLMHNPDNSSNIIRVSCATTNGQARLYTDLLSYHAISVKVREDHSVVLPVCVALPFHQLSPFISTTARIVRPTRFVALRLPK